MDERMIKSPKHYAEGRKFEPKDVIRDWDLNFNLGIAVKYLASAGRKGDMVEDLKKAQQYIQFEIDALEVESKGKKKQEPPTHPNCRCSMVEGGMEDKLDAMLYGLNPMFIALAREEACIVNPIVVELPEGEDLEKLVEKLRNEVGNIGIAGDTQPTEFEKKALDLYNAYLYRLSEIRKEMNERRKSTPPMLGICYRFVQDISLREGFDPTEVLDGMVKKLMEGN